MTPRHLFPLLAAVLLTAACSRNTSQTISPLQTDNEEAPATGRTAKAAGDSTIYGLACEGTSDSLLVLLLPDGSDPVTYDMLQARLNRRVKGRIRTGDNLAVVLSGDSTNEVVSVIDIDVLKGAWAYLAMPVLKKRLATATSPGAQQPPLSIPDSIRERIMQPREYGMRLLRDNTVERIGTFSAQQRLQQQNSLVEYPQQPRYTEWRIWNGKLILTSAPLNIPEANQRYRHETTSDTAEIVLLRKDSLQLRIGSETRSYYRKQE